ncbi:hypothetical protein DR999_PMT19927 [Platysternon megacephalum]|uniref:Uncharacterized protein n=1 Tax=Platysternon megacephalum TaxID=55544 RepID=A0A4D9DLN7_9SAUR|nr:hypothetical protein DR999_PMT19927 [Platysternon megacephalum]
MLQGPGKQSGDSCACPRHPRARTQLLYSGPGSVPQRELSAARVQRRKGAGWAPREQGFICSCLGMKDGTSSATVPYPPTPGLPGSAPLQALVAIQEQRAIPACRGLGQGAQHDRAACPQGRKIMEAGEGGDEQLWGVGSCLARGTLKFEEL